MLDRLADICSLQHKNASVFPKSTTQTEQEKQATETRQEYWAKVSFL